MSLLVPEGIAFGPDGLVPVVVQERASGDVLMLAFANAEALGATADTGFAHFWSRSRGRLWKKGESSGNVLRVRELRADCDKDALLMIVEPAGPACHTGARTCFGESSPHAAGILEALHRVIDDRARGGAEGSYTAALLGKGLDYALRKVCEEATEVLLAAKGESDERLAEEGADLVFHLLVALYARNVTPEQVLDVLRRRRGEA